MECLIARGFGDLCGAKIAGTRNNGVRERFADEHMNRGGWQEMFSDVRDPYMTFDVHPNEWEQKNRCYLLEPAREACVISQMETVLAEPLGTCGTIYEDRMGGRVTVMGFMPWTMLGYPQKNISLRL